MTLDERIENTLNKFGWTISDLPKASATDYTYKKKRLMRVNEEATQWHGRLNAGSYDREDYICHLIDVIDCMKDTLEMVIQRGYEEEDE